MIEDAALGEDGRLDTGELCRCGLRRYDEFVAATERGLRRRAMLALGRHVMPGGVDADDLVQEAYTALVTRYAGMANEVAAYAYASQTVRRAAKDVRHGAQRRSEHWFQRLHLQQAGHEPAAEEVALRRLRAVAVRTALRRLPPAQQRAVRLVDMEEAAYADAAAAMGCTPTAVKGLLQRARARLRAELAGPSRTQQPHGIPGRRRRCAPGRPWPDRPSGRQPRGG